MFNLEQVVEQTVSKETTNANTDTNETIKTENSLGTKCVLHSILVII